MKSKTNLNESRWPNRMAILLALVTFPLIWVGGLVTTYKAGMAVPDWPSTYGYNLFLYPLSTWVSGPFDLFIEHGHRLLGSLAGLTAIALVIVAWRTDQRPWFRWLALGALGLVIAQGLLGGARVLMDSRTFAMLHGCVGPAFFALSVALIVLSSRSWRERDSATESPSAGAVRSLCVLAPCFAYLQLFLGAQVRHVSVTASPETFEVAVVFHVVMALVLLLHTSLLCWKAWRCGARSVAWLTRGLAALMCVQIGLGCMTWIMKYGWPLGLAEKYSFAAGHQVIAGGYWQAMITTAHVAVGSLILATAVATTLHAFRHLRSGAIAVGSAPLIWGLST